MLEISWWLEPWEWDEQWCVPVIFRCVGIRGTRLSTAETLIGPGNRFATDGHTPDEARTRHLEGLPAALRSRQTARRLR